MKKTWRTLAVFFDFAGASNKVKLKSIHSSLANVKTRDTLIRWIDAMLNSRIIYSVRKSETRGTSQGGILSLLLWYLLVNNILRDGKIGM